MDHDNDKLVEAIEDGRIVRVPEFYAKLEGLTIIRKPEIVINEEDTSPRPLLRKEDLTPGDYKKAASNWKDKQVISELLPNWNWIIRMERRKKGLTRKQFSTLLNLDEENIKMLEYGSLPSADFILINKIQETLKINLRIDQKDYSKGIKELMIPPEEPKKQPTEKNSLSGSDIVILEDEI